MKGFKISAHVGKTEILQKFLNFLMKTFLIIIFNNSLP